MKLKNNNELRQFPRSSKNVQFNDINGKIDNIPKMNMDASYVFQKKKSNNIITNNLHPNKSFMHMQSAELNYLKAKKLKNTHISFNNPLLKNNFLHPNYVFGAKQNNNLNRSIMSIKDNFYNRQIDKNNILDSSKQELLEQSGKTNLKLIQKELQFKLLDMSIQIENGNSDDEESNAFSNLQNDKNNNNLWEKNVKNELESYKNEIKTNNTRRKSLNVYDIDQIYNLNNLNKGFKPLNKSINKGFNKCKTNKLGINNNQNIISYRKELSKTNLVLNNSRRKSLSDFRNNLNNINKNSFIGNNKSMYINLNNMSMNKNNMSFINVNNKSMYIHGNNSFIMNKMLLNAEKNREYENKYRILVRPKELYDSLEDEEVIEELEEDFIFISPETRRIFIFDTFILFCILFSSFYYPIYIAQSLCFCTYIPSGIKGVLFFTDFITIFDIVLSFFRAYYNFEFTLIKNNKKIVKHYLVKYFFPDLISGIPVFSISHYLCNKYNPDGNICFSHGIDFKYNCLKGFLGLKIIKLFKVLDKKSNRGINYFYEKISENYTLEKTMKMMLFALLVILGFNIFICYHIYMGRQTYPNWILATNNQDKDFINLYLISFYFLITTITSVGYGDITCVSLGETVFQIILLTIGVIAYSWVVSTIGNYVKKETRASIKYNNDIGLLEEIRISYPKMSFKLYNKIHKHLETVSHQQEKFDTKLLVNNLPYTLKNKLMFIIYENIIKKFIFFRECENSDFIIRVLTSYIPMSAKKGAFIIHEGELVDNIIFVREGRLSLVAAIDLEDPINSIDKYLGENFEDINEKIETKLDNSILNQSTNIGMKIQKAQTEIRTFLKTKDELNDSKIELEIGKRDFDGDDEFDVGNHQFLNILDILKNEHYGEVYMFLQKPSPLSLRVKSKYSELFLLRKHEAQIISKAYPNVWKKIYHKSYHNMKSIKNLTKKIIIHYCNNYGHKYDSNKGVDSKIEVDKGDNFITNLGILNSKKRKKFHNRKIKFNLDENYSPKNINDNNDKITYPKKTILKSRLDNNYNNIEMNNRQNLDDNSPSPSLTRSNLRDNANHSNFSRENSGFVIKVNGKQMNQMNQINKINQMNSMYKMKTLNNNYRYNNNFRVTSKNKFSNTTTGEQNNILNNQLKKINRISSESLFVNKFNNNINNNNKFSNKKVKVKLESKFSNNNIDHQFNNNSININNISINNINNINTNGNQTIDLNSTYKMNSNLKESGNKTFVNNKILQKMNSNVAVRCNSIHFKNIEKEKTDSNCISSLSFLPKNSNSVNFNTVERNKTIQIANDTNANLNDNLNDTKIIQNTSSITQKSEEIVDETPNTINNLSRPLIKKIQKKIKKRRKKKKLYQMLISKISESIARINPNTNLTILNSSLNNSLNNSFLKHDGTNIQNPSNFQASYIIRNNSLTSDKIENNEIINPILGQDLLIIPESPEFDSESSSDNSKSSNESINKNVEEKKKVELSISENYNFSYNKIYDNLNIISEGNYSKDNNLQKSVMKLIGVYLKEKVKSHYKSSHLRNEASEYKKEKEKEKEKSVISIKNNKKEKEKEKEKDKEKSKANQNNTEKKKEEEDVWAFLNEEEHEEHQDINFKLDSSSSKDSSEIEEKNYSKTPKGKFKKNFDFPAASKAKSRFKKNNSNLYEEKQQYGESISPKNRKKKEILKKKTKKTADSIKIKKCTTIIKTKKAKRQSIKTNNFKSNKNVKLENNIRKKDNSNNNDTILSSLDLTINDNIDNQETYIKNFYKTFQKKKKGDIGEEDKNNSKLDSSSNKGLKDK